MTFKQEIQRKLFHQIGLAIPITYLFTSQEFILTFLIPATLLVLIVDVSRLYVPPVSRLFYRIFRPIVRDHELKKLTGSSYFMPACTVVVAFFPKDFAILSMFFLTISDSAAALIGKQFGRHPIFEKSWEGTAAFLISAVIIAILMPGIPLPQKLTGAVAATIIELLPLKIDDNLLIPVGTCLVLSAFLL